MCVRIHANGIACRAAPKPLPRRTSAFAPPASFSPQVRSYMSEVPPEAKLWSNCYNRLWHASRDVNPASPACDREAMSLYTPLPEALALSCAMSHIDCMWAESASHSNGQHSMMRNASFAACAEILEPCVQRFQSKSWRKYSIQSNLRRKSSALNGCSPKSTPSSTPPLNHTDTQNGTLQPLPKGGPPANKKAR